MARTKGSVNKITAEVKERLSNLIDQTVDSLVIEEMSVEQRLKLLQLSLHYVLPKLRSVQNESNTHVDEPLFINVYERKDEEQEAENWADNFEVAETYTVQKPII